MTLYRKKTEEVVAYQYFDFEPDLPAGVCLCNKQQIRLAHVHTPEGLQVISNGDWIVTDGAKERRAYSQSVFELAYEPVP